jgi:hypothetical protein
MGGLVFMEYAAATKKVIPFVGEAAQFIMLPHTRITYFVGGNRKKWIQENSGVLKVCFISQSIVRCLYDSRIFTIKFHD